MNNTKRESSHMVSRRLRWQFPLAFFALALGVLSPSVAYIQNYTVIRMQYLQILPCILVFLAVIVVVGAGIGFFLHRWNQPKGRYAYIAIGIILGIFVHFITSIGYPFITSLVVGLVVFAIMQGEMKPLVFFAHLLFGIALSVCIQLFFLNGSLKQFVNSVINWNNNSADAIVSLHIWILCVMLPFLLWLIDKKLARRVTTIGSIVGSVAIVAGLVIVLVAGGPRDVNVVTKNDEFELSSKDNVVVFLVDSLDAQYVEDFILSEDMRLLLPPDPEPKAEEVEEEDDSEQDEIYTLNERTSKRLLNDFTYFDNVVGGGAPANLGIPALLTGRTYQTDLTWAENREEAYGSSTLFSDLRANGYDVRVYTNWGNLDPANPDEIDNIRTDIDFKPASRRALLEQLIKVSLYDALPYQFKHAYWISSGKISGNAEITTPDTEWYGVNDLDFIEDYDNSRLSVQDNRGTFVVYHLRGAAAPYVMNEDMEKVASSETSLSQQVCGVFGIISRYVQEMKAKGIYDSSTIIIAGTNGELELGQNPAVLIKRRNENHDFAVNSTPLTFANLRASLVDGIVPGAQQAYGPNMFDQPGAASALRTHVSNQNYWKNLYSDKGSWYREFDITDEARGQKHIIRTVDFEPYAYTLNEWIPLSGDDAVMDFPIKGVSGNEGSYRWSNGQDILMSFQIDEPVEEAIFALSVRGVLAGRSQQISVYVNRKLLHQQTVEGRSTIEFSIPGAVAPEGRYDIVIKIPNPTTPKALGINGDERLLAMNLEGVGLYSREGYEALGQP